jgi:hypothetical protein
VAQWHYLVLSKKTSKKNGYFIKLASVLAHLAKVFFFFFFLFSAVTAIDTSGIDTVCEIRKMLEKRSLQVEIVIIAISKIFN